LRIDLLTRQAADLIEHARSEAASRERDERLRSLAENVPSVLMRYDASFRVVYLSRKAEEYTGVPVAEFLGKTNREVGMPESLCDLWEGAITDVFRTGVPRDIEFAFPSSGGARAFLLRLAPETDPYGAVRHVLGVSTDITERKRAEEELRATVAELARSNKELERFAYVASHDLQEPLRMVSSFVGLLKDRYGSVLDEHADEYIGFAVEGAARMKQLLDDLLLYSRVGRGQTKRPIGTADCLATALANLRLAIAESDAVITHGDLPTVQADPTQLAQLLQNLIGNAIKFRRGGVRPEVHVEAEQDDDQWTFRVRDNGIGIAQEQYGRIFEIFQRLHTREKYPGTGIGLAICKKIVERHGGRTWLESKVGEGTTFFFTIPAASKGAEG
jgi:PAS domain S-box-containing protein